MLSVQHITTGYGKKQILTDVSFDVAKGDVVLLTGGNGSGKSIVLKILYGLLKPWTPESRVVIDGVDITGLTTPKIICYCVPHMERIRNIFDDFTVDENLFTLAAIYSFAEARERVRKVYASLGCCIGYWLTGINKVENK